MYNIGIMYMMGTGTVRNESRAYLHYARAYLGAYCHGLCRALARVRKPLCLHGRTAEISNRALFALFFVCTPRLFRCPVLYEPILDVVDACCEVPSPPPNCISPCSTPAGGHWRAAFNLAAATYSGKGTAPDCRAAERYLRSFIAGRPQWGARLKAAAQAAASGAWGCTVSRVCVVS